MLKQLIFGHVIRTEGNMIYVQCGNAIDSYNLDYYRVQPEAAAQIGEVRQCFGK